MVPDRDYYADKHGKLTDDPEQYLSQIAVKGVYLPDAIAAKYGIRDMLVSSDEPAAPRRMKLGIEKPEKKEEEPAKAAEPEAEEPKAAAPAKKEADKGKGTKK